MWRTTYQKLDNLGARESLQNDVKEQDGRQQKNIKYLIDNHQIANLIFEQILF